MSTTELLKTGPRIDRQLPLYEELAVSKEAETIGARIARLRRETAQIFQVSCAMHLRESRHLLRVAAMAS